MSLPRSLLVVVVVVCIAICAADFPCPDPADIAPCICTTDEAYNINLDCSSVTSEAELASAFATPLAFNDVTKLTINPSVPSASFTILPHAVFGDKTFQVVEITNTLIQTVEEETFVNSHPTLTFLDLHNNDISSFPIETLELFTALREFDISDNNLSGISPDIVSLYLDTLNLSGNKGFRFTATTFFGAENLTQLYLSDMDAGNTMPAGMFLPLKQLNTLHLNNNGISGVLIENFINNELKPLQTVQLIGNEISSIHNLSVTGINAEGTISFRSNQIQLLPHENWGVLVSEVTQNNAIDLTLNPLVCGCDLMWLLFDSALLAKLDENTACVTGNLLTELPLDWFLEHCSNSLAVSPTTPPL